MNRRLFSALLLAASTLMFSACMTESEEGGSVNMALLVNEWKISAATVSPAVPIIGTNMLAVFDDCSKSAILEFKSNGTFTITPDETECEDSEDVADTEDEGTYTVNGNTLTVVDSEDDTYVFTVIELTATTLKYTENIGSEDFDDNISRTATFTYTAQ